MKNVRCWGRGGATEGNISLTETNKGIACNLGHGAMVFWRSKQRTKNRH
jgi:hypothetical protein